MNKKQLIFDTFKKLPISNCGHFDLSAYKAFEEMVAIAKPKNVLEIGFHAGHSAVLWLAISEANMTSIDPAIAPWLNWSHTEKSILILDKTFPNKFSFVRGMSQDSGVIEKLAAKHKENPYDFLVVDGLHNYDACRKDLELALKFDIEYVFLDDYVKSHPCIMDVVKNASDNFEVVKIWSDIGMEGAATSSPDETFAPFACAPINSVLIKRK